MIGVDVIQPFYMVECPHQAMYNARTMSSQRPGLKRTSAPCPWFVLAPSANAKTPSSNTARLLPGVRPVAGAVAAQNRTAL
jgi:hypothetical protein